jgi:arylsulfatase A-like enzyme
MLIISIDSLSHERLFTQLKSAQTPNIDKLAKNGTTFEQSISSADGTELSWISLFTSQYPIQKSSSKSLTKFDFENKTHFHFLKNSGYHVYGIIPEGGVLFGLEDIFENNDPGYTSEFRIYDGLGNKILKEFDNMSTEPWMFFIHLLDLHLPLFIPKTFSDASFGDNPYDQMLSALDSWIGILLKKINLKNTIVLLTADHGEFVPSINLNGEIISYFGKESMHTILWKIEGHIPRCLVPLRNKLFSIARRFVRQKKIDHTKNLDLSEHQKRSLLFNRNDEQGYLFDDLVHTPLIFSGFNIPQKEISQQISHNDIFPTLFELANLPIKLEHVQGRSLTPLLENKPFDEKSVYLEGRYRIDQDDSFSVIGIRTSTYKYFRGRKKTSDNIFLFHLKNDPLEEINIVKQNPEIVEEFEKIISSIVEKNSNQIKTKELTKEEQNKVELELRKLGYI